MENYEIVIFISIWEKKRLSICAVFLTVKIISFHKLKR